MHKRSPAETESRAYFSPSLANDKSQVELRKVFFLFSFKETNRLENVKVWHTCACAGPALPPMMPPAGVVLTCTSLLITPSPKHRSAAFFKDCTCQQRLSDGFFLPDWISVCITSFPVTSSHVIPRPIVADVPFLLPGSQRDFLDLCFFFLLPSVFCCTFWTQCLVFSSSERLPFRVKPLF